MSRHALSIRLDHQAEEALAVLTATGRTQSQAIRDALVQAAGSELQRQLRDEAEACANDPDDVAEAADVLAFMESLRTDDAP